MFLRGKGEDGFARTELLCLAGVVGLGSEHPIYCPPTL